jgi:DNA-binding MarR family transcriptional regulator
MESPEHDLDLLEHIARSPKLLHQRDLARIAGLSLGMTNMIVKRLAQKGWLTIRKVNNRNVRYAVSPAGIDQISRRSYRYFRRTVRNIVSYRETIERFVREVGARGFQRLLLVGSSDLDFIVEYACGTCGVEYVQEGKKREASAPVDGAFLLYSESYIPDAREQSSAPAAAFLQEVVSNGAGETPHVDLQRQSSKREE